ncbi:unnamed protein product [Medioppia subpectinata]|uniref:Uncharacterized protein n=1 Tax=Medioppia subpectinata TaxID=1979941 RepID=A0A7R9PUW6_9ACAR|nr:unnamed protein product [Medioppia subpectinata]CAG2102197.1 unnamed protein product [Medioppia subpectinata]
MSRNQSLEVIMDSMGAMPRHSSYNGFTYLAVSLLFQMPLMEIIFVMGLLILVLGILLHFVELKADFFRLRRQFLREEKLRIEMEREEELRNRTLALQTANGYSTGDETDMAGNGLFNQNYATNGSQKATFRFNHRRHTLLIDCRTDIFSITDHTEDIRHIHIDIDLDLIIAKSLTLQCIDQIEPQNETTLSTNSSIDTITSSTPQAIIDLISPPNTRTPLFPQPLASSLAFSPPDRQRAPLSLTQLGVPIKTNRFGLDPLHYPFKPTNANFHAIRPQNHQSFNRRIGEIIESTTRRLVMNETQDVVNKDRNAANGKPTNGSTNKTHLNIDSKLQTHRNGSELEMKDVDNFSPMPVYKSESIIDKTDGEVVSMTTPKGTYLHSEDFAKMLNNMYYQKPVKTFAPMMHRFDPKNF